jgi:hypothetical protein
MADRLIWFTTALAILCPAGAVVLGRRDPCRHRRQPGVRHGSRPSRRPSQRLDHLALAGSFELLMTLIRMSRQQDKGPVQPIDLNQRNEIADYDEPPAFSGVPTLEQTVRAWRHAGHSQRAIAR